MILFNLVLIIKYDILYDLFGKKTIIKQYFNANLTEKIDFTTIFESHEGSTGPAGGA